MNGMRTMKHLRHLLPASAASGLFLLLGFPTPSSAQEAPQPKERLVFPPGQSRPAASPEPGAAVMNPRESIAQFFRLLSRERVEDAYSGLVKGSIIEERKEDVELLKDRTTRALDAYGPIRDYEVLSELAVGTTLRRFTCLSHNEELPLRWRFYFYDSARGWKLVDLRVDDGLVELFDEASQPAGKDGTGSGR